MNHLGLGDNATFVSIRARYNSSSVMEEDNYLLWSFYSEPNKQYAMDELLVLTGNSTNRIEQIYLTNPNVDYAVELEVMVAVIDDEYSFFNNIDTQVGKSYSELELTDIKTYVVGESVTITNSSDSCKSLVYFTITNIGSIKRTVQILVIEDSVLGNVFLEFLTEEDAIQAESLFNYVKNNPSVNINDLEPLKDLEPPVIYFNSSYATTGDLITLSGATAVPYSTLDGNTFSTEIEFATYSTAGEISKLDLIDGLIDNVTDARDGLLTLGTSSINIQGVTMSQESISATGSYSITFNIEDIAQNNLNHIVLSINVY
jgi:hypothetical protein